MSPTQGDRQAEEGGKTLATSSLALAFLLSSIGRVCLPFRRFFAKLRGGGGGRD